MNTYSAQCRYQVLHKSRQANAQQKLHKLVRQGITGVSDTLKHYQERNSDWVADRQTPLPGANPGVYCHKTKFLPREIILVPNQHSMGGKLQDWYNISNEKYI